MKGILMVIMILTLVSALVSAEVVVISADVDIDTEVLVSSDSETLIELSFGSFEREPINIDNGVYYRLILGEEPFLTEKGNPQLPYINRSIVIPDRAQTKLIVLDAKYTEYSMNVIPSKGDLYRDQKPEEIPYVFSDQYLTDSFYPGKLAELSRPFIIRDFRGQTVSLYPFQYNPAKGTVRVYESIKIAIQTKGESDVNIITRTRQSVAKDFNDIYESLFLNYNEPRFRYPVLDEVGRKIVICHDPYLEAIQPYVDWKNRKGILTELYAVSEIGTSPTEIKDFISDQYYLDDGLTFVQFVGNGNHIPTFRSRGGAADPVYALIDGDDDYPDLFVGRFSANNVEQLETQVERSIYYERDINTENEWLSKATGIASSEGSNPSDIEHMNGIRDLLLDYGYSPVDQIYPPHATIARVRDAVEEGRGIINYAGHGRALSWSTTGFNRTSVDRLENDNKLPFIFSVACQNGNFTDNVTCLAEAWLRATNDSTGVPTGGIAFYGSSVNQLWYPPLVAQNEMTRLLTSETFTTIGGLWFNASARMINDRGAQGAAEFKNWNIFGDVSLQGRTKNPQELLVVRNAEIFIGETAYEVQTNVPEALVSLSYENQLLSSGYTDQDGNISFENVSFPLSRTNATVTITAKNYVAYVGDLEIVPNEGPYVIINSYSVKGQGPGHAVEYGNLAYINLSLKNVGIEIAENVHTRLVSTDKYVSIVDSVRAFNDIEPDEILDIHNAFSIRIADNIPNKHQSVLMLTVRDDEGNNWSWRFSFKSNAPKLITGDIIIDDSEQGNGNGILDPGETTVVTFPALNVGNALTQAVNVSLVIGSPYVTIDGNGSLDMQPIKIGETSYPTFTVTASAELPSGSIVPFGLAVTSGAYYAQKTYQIPIGAVAEDFETGDFSTFEWSFDGNEPWIIDHSSVYEGSYSAKSGDISNDQSSIISLTLNVTEPGFISFHRRVSSAMGYHFLRFSINDELKGQWSGDSNWTQVSYPVNSGEITFKWEYRKDSTPEQFYDSAWIDNIKFPTSGATFEGPVFHAYPSVLNYGTVAVGDVKEQLFYIRNFGSQLMTGTIRLIDGFTVLGNDNWTQHRNDDIIDYQIQAESNIPVILVFNPLEDNDYSGYITITSNANNQSEMNLYVNAEGGVVSAEEDILSPVTTELSGNYPNPFNPSTTISYAIENDGFVSIEIFNIRGQLVNSLVNERKDAGLHSVIWDGSNREGAKVSSGVYFYKMRAGDYENIRRMLFLK